ncbi:MAG: hypothetical protein AAGA72_00380 [Pseudomonadota bacterium]
MTKPIEKLKDGLLCATIWMNANDEGKVRYSITLARNYQIDGDWKETNSFSPTELLKVSVLAKAAYSRIGELRRQAGQLEDA